MSDFQSAPNNGPPSVNWVGVVITVGALVLIASTIIYLVTW
jgi:hypothetical protein